MTDDRTLRRVFEQFGHLKAVHLVKNVITGKSRGYAFVEFEEERDLKSLFTRRHDFELIHFHHSCSGCA